MEGLVADIEAAVLRQKTFVGSLPLSSLLEENAQLLLKEADSLVACQVCVCVCVCVYMYVYTYVLYMYMYIHVLTYCNLSRIIHAYMYVQCMYMYMCGHVTVLTGSGDPAGGGVCGN